MKSYDVVGYAYQADTICTDCGRKVMRALRHAGKAPEDPTDESSFDSDDYPKVIFADMAEEDDVCGMCHAPLLETD